MSKSCLKYLVLRIRVYKDPILLLKCRTDIITIKLTFKLEPGQSNGSGSSQIPWPRAARLRNPGLQGSSHPDMLLINKLRIRIRNTSTFYRGNDRILPPVLRSRDIWDGTGLKLQLHQVKRKRTTKQNSFFLLRSNPAI